MEDKGEQRRGRLAAMALAAGVLSLAAASTAAGQPPPVVPSDAAAAAASIGAPPVIGPLVEGALGLVAGVLRAVEDLGRAVAPGVNDVLVLVGKLTGGGGA